MSFVQLFVEDELSEVYEILAAQVLGVDVNRRQSRRQKVRAARLDVSEFTSKDSLLDSVERTYRSGSPCILFILDEEDYNESPDRSNKLAEFRQAFMELCQHLEDLPDNHYLKQVKVTCIITKSCLECWLLADPQAIVAAIRGSSSYIPKEQNTENHNPRQARDHIAHIIREVGRRTNKRQYARMSGHSVKTMGTKIALYVAPERARHRNFSLDYFYEMVTCKQSGCDRPFPEPT
jgi:hypothetical protein